MMENFWTVNKIAGLLHAGTAVFLVLLTIFAIRGDVPGIYGLFRPLEELADRLPVSPWVLLAEEALIILPLLGFGLLTHLLQEAGAPALSILSLVLFAFAALLYTIDIAFQHSVTPWAAEHAARTGSAPDIYEPLRHWMTTSVQNIYMILGLLGIIGYGWAILRTGLLPGWLGWLAIGWGGIWTLETIITYDAFPGMLYILPVVMGIVLLAQR